MTRVSRKKLKKEMKAKIDKQFIKTVSSFRGNRGSVFLLEELLSSSEHTMLTKRLAAVLMLSRGVSSYRVHKILNMSEQTTARIKKDVILNRYPYVRKAVRRKKDRELFWADMEALIRFGMPEMGKNRWKWLDDIR